MIGYFKFLKAPKQEPHHQMKFSVILNCRVSPLITRRPATTNREVIGDNAIYSSLDRKFFIMFLYVAKKSVSEISEKIILGIFSASTQS